MKRGIAIVCFAAGCLASLLALDWYVAVLVTRNSMWPFPSDVAEIEALFVVWGLIMFATFYRNPRPIWMPLFEITSARIKAARLLLACTLINCVVWLIACVALWAVQVRGPLPWIFCLLASGVTLLNAVYVFIHWALRPENLFSERFRRFADDPIVFLIFDPLLRRRKIR
jgi:hypothetical protein